MRARRGIIGIPVGNGAGASLSASDALPSSTGYGVEQLWSPRRSDRTRTADAAGVKTWTRCPGGSPAVEVVLIAGHNWTSSAAVTLEAADSDSWGAPALTFSVPYRPRLILMVLARPYAYGWWRLSVSDPTNPAGYLELGLFEPMEAEEVRRLQPVSMGSAPQSDPSPAVVTPHGDRTPRDLGTSQDMKFDMVALRRAHAQRLQDVLQERGAGGALLVCPDVTRDLYGGCYGYVRALPQRRRVDPSGTRWHLTGLEIVADRDVA